MSSALAHVVQAENANTVVISNSNTGKCIGPRLSIKMNASFIANVVDIPMETSPITIKKTFSGKAFETAQSNAENTILALSPNSYTINENLNSSCQFESMDFTSESSNVNSEE